MGGIFLSLMFGFYLYGYGLGTVFIDKKYINPTTGKIYEVAEIIAVTTSTVYSVMVIGGILPLFPAIIRALVCMKKVFEVIERVPKIKDEPGCLDNIQLKNKIVYKNVQFRYPTQVAKTRDIFAAASFEIKAG
jgi:ABC-type multidrug transport system fused ATPase/permease subunit